MRIPGPEAAFSVGRGPSLAKAGPQWMLKGTLLRGAMAFSFT
jgi:hypothetical protein